MIQPGGAPGPLALVGSGEYLPVMLDVERSLITGRYPRYVQIPTAAAPEGAASLQHWIDLGRRQAERLGVEAVPVIVRNRQEADDPAIVEQVAGAGLIYLSGGDPHFLSSTLRGTLLAAAIEREWRAGAALAGCSAGAMAMTSWVPSVKRLGLHPDPGLALVPHLRVIPHFDRMGRWIPDLVTRYLMHAPDGVTVVGIDEDTALVAAPDDDATGLVRWRVEGRQSAWVISRHGRTEYQSGQVLTAARG